MRIFLFVSLSLTINCAIAILDVRQFSDDQICIFAKDPPLPAQITFEIEARKIICDEGVAINKSEISTSKKSERFLKIKKWNKMLRGKSPIYSTRSGTNLRIDTFGDEKSIIIDRNF